jgi:lysine 2,3-aminomutase
MAKKVEKFNLSDHTLEINPRKYKYNKFDFSEIEDYVLALVGSRDYQYKAIKEIMIYLWGESYKSIIDLAKENWKTKTAIQERFQSEENFLGRIPLPDRLSGVVHMATGTGKSYAMFAVAYLSIVLGKVKRVLVLGPSSTVIEAGLTGKFREYLFGERGLELKQNLPQKYRNINVNLLNENDPIVDYSIVIENINSIYNKDRNSIGDTLFNNTEEVLVLSDEVHHAYSHLKYTGIGTATVEEGGTGDTRDDSMDWRKELSMNLTGAEEIIEALNVELTADEIEKLKQIIERYPMSVPRYYLSLINKDDPDDPIKKLCVPSIKETDMSGSFDTSGEADNTVLVGLQHKYKETGMLLSTNSCAMYCRHCFRKRLVGQNDDEVNKNFENIISYIKDHQDMTNVLISGGDAFLNSNQKIENYLKELTKIDHLVYIRFGTRLPVVFPLRIYSDEEFLNILDRYNKIKQIYVVTHFNHPNEITEESKKAVRELKNRGIVIRNQTVLLKGVNDKSETLEKLMKGLVGMGVVPYYIFQCRPVSGVKNQFQVPLKRACELIDDTRKNLSGMSKSFKYCMSHRTGKIEILGSLNEGKIIFKHHQSKDPRYSGRLFELEVDENQAWLPDDFLDKNYPLG